MFSYRFTNPQQKAANLAILRDLLVDHADDQPAKTALSNAITMAEETTVTGDLDSMIARTNKLQVRWTIGLSVFFILFAAVQFVWGYSLGGWYGIGNYAMGAATLVYGVALWGMWRIQQRYYTTLKWLESMQLELPTIPGSLLKAVH